MNSREVKQYSEEKLNHKIGLFLERILSTELRYLDYFINIYFTS